LCEVKANVNVGVLPLSQKNGTEEKHVSRREREVDPTVKVCM